jgi:hypothetical protein
MPWVYTISATHTYLVVSVGEVETADVHAGIDHLDKHVHVPAGGTQGAHDLDLTALGVYRLKDVAKLDSD